MSTVEVIAHRGGSWPGIEENSLLAFVEAASRGLRWSETDVRASVDGVLYAVHDPDLERTAGIPAQIRQLQSSRLDRITLSDGSALPRLTDVLDAVPGMQLNVDVKDESGVVPMIALASDPAFADRLRLASFSSRRLRALRRALPEVRTSVGMAEVAGVLAAGSLGLRHLPWTVDCVQVPERMRIPVVTSRFVRGVHAASRQVHVWTVNDAEQMTRLIARGVDALVTDEVELALRIAGEHAAT